MEAPNAVGSVSIGNHDGGVDHYDLPQPIKLMCAEAKKIEICYQYLLF